MSARLAGGAFLRTAGYAGSYVAGIVSGLGIYVASKERQLPSPPLARPAAAAGGKADAAKIEKVAKSDTSEKLEKSEADPAASIAKYKRKILKLQRTTQERVHWPAMDADMLGLQPRLWLEVLDEKHRYASLLYDYWRRWQLSDTRDHFANWLDHGQGSLIDLPHAPRRLLDEWRVIYLKREQQALFRVHIEEGTGRFLWDADGTLVNLPTVMFRDECTASVGVVCESCSKDGIEAVPPKTQREQQVLELLRPVLSTGCRRDRLLNKAWDQADAACTRGDEATPELLAEIAAPLIKEGMLRQLRDPFFSERLDAATTPNGHAHLREMAQLPEDLLPELEWDDLLTAIEADQGLHMKTPFPKGASRAEGKGIFVLDTHGQLYCGSKIRGIFHHSSFVRGHAVQVAGGLTIVNGWLQQLSPHSGHYQPSQDHIEQMMSNWKQAGVSFSHVELKPYVKM